jgi:hypothetical protein
MRSASSAENRLPPWPEANRAANRYNPRPIRIWIKPCALSAPKISPQNLFAHHAGFGGTPTTRIPPPRTSDPNGQLPSAHINPDWYDTKLDLSLRASVSPRSREPRRLRRGSSSDKARLFFQIRMIRIWFSRCTSVKPKKPRMHIQWYLHKLIQTEFLPQRHGGAEKRSHKWHECTRIKKSSPIISVHSCDSRPFSLCLRGEDFRQIRLVQIPMMYIPGSESRAHGLTTIHLNSSRGCMTVSAAFNAVKPETRNQKSE